jgi:serine/threonine protein kinase
VDLDGHIKITDFGLSREDFGRKDRSDSFCGSPEYMAPEMLSRGEHTRMIDFY